MVILCECRMLVRYGFDCYGRCELRSFGCRIGWSSVGGTGVELFFRFVIYDTDVVSRQSSSRAQHHRVDDDDAFLAWEQQQQQKTKRTVIIIIIIGRRCLLVVGWFA